MLLFTEVNKEKIFFYTLMLADRPRKTLYIITLNEKNGADVVTVFERAHKIHLITTLRQINVVQ